MTFLIYSPVYALEVFQCEGTVNSSILYVYTVQSLSTAVSLSYTVEV